MKKRKINFSAGPAALPEDVLQQAADAVREYKSTGVSILETSHRSKEFAAIVEESKELVRELCGIGDEYDIIWQHGGGRMQFCMVPMNFLGSDGNAGYIDSGHWAEEAMEYATHYGDVQILASSKADNYNHLPAWPTTIPPQLSYLHYATNNTIFGTQWHHIPTCGVPLIADMSSDIFCSRRDYTKCALFYAAAQKNLGAAGVALVVIHKSMMERIRRELPPMLNYKAQVKENSILNTANVFGVYTSLLMLRWIQSKGIDVLEQENKRKAKLLYEEIERNRLFAPIVKHAADRSIQNVTFTAIDKKTKERFTDICEQEDIVGVKGHRLVGGFRVSIYNAINVADVEQLVSLMKDFENKA